MKGANVIFQDVHVSGHACQEEIKLIYSLVKPKYAIPVHGEYRHLICLLYTSDDDSNLPPRAVIARRSE